MTQNRRDILKTALGAAALAATSGLDVLAQGARIYPIEFKPLDEKVYDGAAKKAEKRGEPDLTVDQSRGVVGGAIGGTVGRVPLVGSGANKLFKVDRASNEARDIEAHLHDIIAKEAKGGPVIVYFGPDPDLRKLSAQLEGGGISGTLVTVNMAEAPKDASGEVKRLQDRIIRAFTDNVAAHDKGGNQFHFYKQGSTYSADPVLVANSFEPITDAVKKALESGATAAPAKPTADR